MRTFDGADDPSVIWAFKDDSFEVKQGEAEEFIDTPVKFYASGMQVHLAYMICEQ